MASKEKESAAIATKPDMSQFLEFGKGRTEAMLKAQKELLDEYQAATHTWAARVKSEVQLWSDLAAKVTASHSIPEGLEAYRDFASQRFQMAIEDGQRLFDEGQKMMSMLTKSANGKNSGMIG